MQTKTNRFGLKFILSILVSIAFTFGAFGQESPSVKIFISVDMEGIGGIGTPKMTSSSGKDYATGRQLMTDEVNTVVRAIFSLGPAEIVVNDSHGDMQNLLHTQLDSRVTYIQSNIKPLGMVQGLDGSFDAAIFIGYHARAGTANGFLAHTGSGSVKGLWINNTEVGEAGLNAYYAGANGVPVILASGDETFTQEFAQLVPCRMVSTKVAVGGSAAKLKHPEAVNEELKAQTIDAIIDLPNAKPLRVSSPVTFRIQLEDPTHADIVMGIPGTHRVDGYSVEYQASSMDEAYRLIRIIYKYIGW